MPRGKTHENVALVSLFPTFFAGYFLFNDIALAAILTLATLFGAFFMSPDLDTKSLNYFRWGWLRFIWIPYRKLIPHRSPLSHSLFIGPLLKLAYLTLLSMFMVLLIVLVSGLSIVWFAKIVSNTINNLMTASGLYFIAILAGILWANAQHILLDSANTLLKSLRH